MKRLFILTLLIVSFGVSTKAQDYKLPDQLYKNSVYGYVGSTLVCYSTGLFYERDVMELKRSFVTARAGVGLYAFLWGDYGYYYGLNIGQILGKKKHHFEYNIGFAFYEVTYDDYTEKYPAAYIGYRYQKPEGRILFRTGFGWPEQASLGVGVRF